MVFVANLIINIDHGVMPAGSIVIKNDLKESNTEYGLLGSIVFAGLVVGSVAAGLAFQKFDMRLTLASVIFLNACTQIAFTFTDIYLLLLAIRFMAGFFQVFFSIYWPVFTDAYSVNERQKTTWMSLYLLSAPVGVLMGYVLTT